MQLWEDFWNNVIAFAVTAAVAGVVSVPLFFMIRARRLLPLQRLRPGTWYGRDVWLAFVVVVFVPNVAADLLESLGFFSTTLFDKEPSLLQKRLWSSPLALLLTLAFLFWLLFLTSRTRPSHLGITVSRWPQNVVLGYLAFVVLTPVVLGFYGLIQWLYLEVLNISPEVHPFAKESLMFREGILLFFTVTVSASLIEELVFRGILQGWLRRASFMGHIMVIMVTLGLGLAFFVSSLVPHSDQPAVEANPGPLVFALVLALGYGIAFYRIWSPLIWNDGILLSTNQGPEPAGMDVKKETRIPDTIHGGPLSASADWQKKNVMLAIFGSSMVWCVVHSDVWPSPIPLFILGLGLGFLAYRTQSLLPNIVLHSLFNTVACLAIFIPRIRESL